MRRTARLLLVATAAAAAVLPAIPAGADASTTSFALIGDTPYGPNQLWAFSRLSSTINADPDVEFVAHSGDIKDGSTLCSDQIFSDTYAEYQGFQDAFWYTPGDNEWTDCHRTNNGAYNPLERLAKIRAMFFQNPSSTTGGTPMAVTSQSSNPTYSTYVENSMFTKANVTFGAVHVVGSNNSLALWTGQAAVTPAQQAEYDARNAANLAWIDTIFDTAIAENRAGVVLMMQAEPTTALGLANTRTKILARAAAFGKPVLLMHGDEHVYRYTTNYGGVANLTRVENYGAGSAITDDGTNKWVKITINPSAASLFTVTPMTVPVGTPITPVPDNLEGVALALAVAGIVVLAGRRVAAA